MDVFQTARQVSAEEACLRYTGVKPVLRGRRAWCRCPLHGEKTASCSFSDGLFYCFGCHRGGSSVDFVSALFGIPIREAAQRICTDFQIRVTGSGVPRAKPRLSRAEVERAIAALDTIFVGYLRWCNLRLNEFAADAADERKEQALYLLLKERERAAMISEELLNAPYERQAELLAQHAHWAQITKKQLMEYAARTGERYWGENA